MQMTTTAVFNYKDVQHRKIILNVLNKLRNKITIILTQNTQLNELSSTGKTSV